MHEGTHIPKLRSIQERIYDKESAIVAFSGGVDSSVLACIAQRSLDKKAVAVTVKLRSFPESELQCVKKVAREIGIQHRVIYLDEFEFTNITDNSPRRCYYCKKEILSILNSVRQEMGFNVIIEGSNASDISSYRPGKQAMEEAGPLVYSPYIDIDVSKDEIRDIARNLKLSVAEKKAVPCLASRFPYGIHLTKKGIERVEMAEDFLKRLGFEELRVRDHDGIARIEIKGSDMLQMLDMRSDVFSYLHELGFSYVTLDLAGFRSGSMDEVL